MTMRLLLATDGSDDARAAATWLGAAPLPPDAGVRVVTVVAIPPSPIDVPPVRELQDSLRAAAHEVAAAAATALRARWPRTEARVLEGDPREEIVRAAEEWPADLIVLGARGLGTVAGFLLGSVSIGITRHAPCPVLVVKGGARPLRTVLVAVDGSEQAAAAVAFLARLPLAPGTAVRLLAAIERPSIPGAIPAPMAGLLPEAADRIVAERRAALAPLLARAAAALAGRVATVEQRTTVGYPAEVIARAAAETDVDLVVLGARGLGTMKRLLLGSVSEAVLRHVERPVLIVRGGHT